MSEAFRADDNANVKSQSDAGVCVCVHGCTVFVTRNNKRTYAI